MTAAVSLLAREVWTSVRAGWHERRLRRHAYACAHHRALAKHHAAVVAKLSGLTVPENLR